MRCFLASEMKHHFFQHIGIFSLFHFVLATNLADLLNRASETSYSLPAKQRPQSQTSPSSKAEHVLFVCSFVLMWDFSDMCIRCCLVFRVHQNSLPKQDFFFFKKAFLWETHWQQRGHHRSHNLWTALWELGPCSQQIRLLFPTCSSLLSIFAQWQKWLSWQLTSLSWWLWK